MTRAPPIFRNAAAELAKLDGVSFNQFITTAVAEKLGTIRAARDFLLERFGSAKPRDMMNYLRRAPKVAPTPGDERQPQVAADAFVRCLLTPCPQDHRAAPGRSPAARQIDDAQDDDPTASEFSTGNGAHRRSGIMVRPTATVRRLAGAGIT